MDEEYHAVQGMLKRTLDSISVIIVYIRGQSVPITLLVFEQVLAKYCCGTVLFGHLERGFFKFIMFGKATIRRRGFSEDGRCVLGDLDKF
ncbi:MAG: hypothetical protein Q7U51_04395, partial [Methanoregula sp.]|nr:hypothetical protein [Methanoregula sp.]